MTSTRALVTASWVAEEWDDLAAEFDAAEVRARHEADSWVMRASHARAQARLIRKEITDGA